jgi:hypothetical protein
MSTTFEDDDVDYEDETRAPFLKHDNHDAPIIPRKPTPLPIRQFSALLSLWLAESIVEHSISPYFNQVRTAYNAAALIYELYACHAKSNTAPPPACQRPPDRGRRCTKGGVLHGYHRESLCFAHYARKRKRNGASDVYHRYPYTMLPRLSPRSSGTAFPTMLAASPYFCRASRVRSFPLFRSASPALFWRSFSGMILYNSRKCRRSADYRLLFRRKPRPARRAKREHRHREMYDSRAHRRN